MHYILYNMHDAYTHVNQLERIYTVNCAISHSRSIRSQLDPWDWDISVSCGFAGWLIKWSWRALNKGRLEFWSKEIPRRRIEPRKSSNSPPFTPTQLASSADLITPSKSFVRHALHVLTTHTLTCFLRYHRRLRMSTATTCQGIAR